MSNDFFPPRPEAAPSIYAYEDTNPQYKGLLKVGYTAKSAQERVAAQYPTRRPGKAPYRIVLDESAMRNDGTVFDDHAVHRYLREHGIKNPEGEWFQCSAEDVRAAILAIKVGEPNAEYRTLDFKMRPEQQEAVERTAAYFTDFKKDKSNKGKTPHFLWNAKMRFGKTFAAYQLAKKMGWKKVLVLTFKPAVPVAVTQPADAAGQPTPKPGMEQLIFSFDGSSWVEVKDAAGHTVFSQMNAKGTTQVVEGRPPFQLVVGNASQVRLQYKDQPVDLRPHTRVEVARLTLD